MVKINGINLWDVYNKWIGGVIGAKNSSWFIGDFKYGVWDSGGELG